MGQGTGAGMSTHVPQKPRSPNMEAQSTGDKPGGSQDVADKSRSPSSVSPTPPGCCHLQERRAGSPHTRPGPQSGPAALSLCSPKLHWTVGHLHHIFPFEALLLTRPVCLMASIISQGLPIPAPPQ